MFRVVLDFEFRFRVWVRKGSTRSESTRLPSLARHWELWQWWRACDAMQNDVDIRLQSLDKLHIHMVLLDSKMHYEKGNSLVSVGNLRENYNL